MLLSSPDTFLKRTPPLGGGIRSFAGTPVNRLSYLIDCGHGYFQARLMVTVDIRRTLWARAP
jgi:hypothetical protein